MLSQYSRRFFSVSKNLIITSVGKDRIGYIRVVSDIIIKHNGNILRSEHLTMWGSFTELILAKFPTISVDRVNQDLKTISESTGICIEVEEATEPKESALESESYSLNMKIESADNTGALFNVTSYLSSLRINIEVLKTEQYPAPMGGTTLFNMTCSLSVPGIIELGRLEEKLKEIGDQLNMDISIQPVGAN